MIFFSVSVRNRKLIPSRMSQKCNFWQIWSNSRKSEPPICQPRLIKCHFSEWKISFRASTLIESPKSSPKFAPADISCLKLNVKTNWWQSQLRDNKRTLCSFIFELRRTQNLTDTFRDAREFRKTILLVNNLVTQPQNTQSIFKIAFKVEL